MPIVCGIKFRGAGKVYFFDPAGLELVSDDYVIVQTTRGKELAQVAEAPHEIDAGEIVGSLKPVVRQATPLDLVQAERYRQREQESIDSCNEQAKRFGLDMDVVGAEYSYDGSRLTFFFTSEDRIDFRELVRELAHVYKTRIELRQIGVRDEAKLLGGVGKCGRSLCCSTWLQSFAPISIRMAKQQNLPLSPMEISGACGRLLCCLGYEDEYYKMIRKQFPRVGKVIDSPVGRAKVIRVSALKETVRLLLEDGSTVDLTAGQLAGEEPLHVEEPPTVQQELDRHLLSQEPVSASAKHSDRPRRSPTERPAAPRNEPQTAAPESAAQDTEQDGPSRSSSQSRRSRRRRPRKAPASQPEAPSQNSGARRAKTAQDGEQQGRDSSDGGSQDSDEQKLSQGSRSSSRRRRRRPHNRPKSSEQGGESS